MVAGADGWGTDCRTTGATGLTNSGCDLAPGAVAGADVDAAGAGTINIFRNRSVSGFAAGAVVLGAEGVGAGADGLIVCGGAADCVTGATCCGLVTGAVAGVVG